MPPQHPQTVVAPRVLPPWPVVPVLAPTSLGDDPQPILDVLEGRLGIELAAAAPAVGRAARIFLAAPLDGHVTHIPKNPSASIAITRVDIVQPPWRGFIPDLLAEGRGHLPR